MHVRRFEWFYPQFITTVTRKGIIRASQTFWLRFSARRNYGPTLRCRLNFSSGRVGQTRRRCVNRRGFGGRSSCNGSLTGKLSLVSFATGEGGTGNRFCINSCTTLSARPSQSGCELRKVYRCTRPSRSASHSYMSTRSNGTST